NGTVNVAKYWVDGQEMQLSDGTNSAKANSIFVSNDAVYVAGFDDGAVYWKDNTEIRLSCPAANPYYESGNSIFVSSNDVYVAGGNVDSRAVYWKNGTEVLLDKANVYGNSS